MKPAAPTVASTPASHRPTEGDAESGPPEVEGRYKALFEAVHDAVLVVDRDHVIESMNVATRKMFGYDAPEAVGRPLACLFAGGAASEISRGIERSAMSGGAAPCRDRFELLGRRRDGTAFPVELSLAPVSADGRAGALAVIRDLSREADLRTAKEAAEAASRSKSSFLANMSHELRTPLNAIIGFAEVLMGELLGPLGAPKYAEYARDIKESGDHLLQLINHILDLSRIEVGRYELRKERVAPDELIKDAVRFVTLSAQQAGVQLEREMGGALEPGWLDRRALRQVLLNLLSNAIKFTPPGGRVKVSAGFDDRDLVIVVADNGIGIAESELGRLGKPFEQVANPLTRDHAGSGLGLAISRALVEMHGGRLAIASEIGVGTTVTVRLPLTASEAGAA